ncbi:hypothetical protein J6590_063827 [Homalodisca vitripennis]|nr:hypothetical protein J6590_063827 [Homalodisca vitripennis]
MVRDGRCTELLDERMTKEECCATNGVETAWSSDDLDAGTLFFWRVLGGGVPCHPCRAVLRVGMIRPTSPLQYEVECTVRSTVTVGVGLQTSVAFDISLQLAFYSPSQVGISAMFTFAVKYLAKKP